MTLIFRLAGQARRSPHEYHAIDRLTYRPKQRLLNTHECVHASVRIRMGLRGYGYNDKGFYDSQGLAGWTMEGTEAPTATTSISGRRASELATMVDVKWVKKDSQGGNDPDLVMPEDLLGELEHDIMKSWPDVEKGFALIRPGTHLQKMNKSSTDRPEPSPKHSIRNGQVAEKNQVIEIGKVIRSPTLQTL
jgi:hypothetical protein